MWCARTAVAAIALAALAAAQVAPANNTADRYFIDRIFKKYGDKGVISFEGFEHLLESLGLGGSVWTTRHDLELHRVNGTFRALHDVQHRHPRSVGTQLETPSSILQAKSCLSPQELLEVYGLEEEPGVISIGPATFMELCPALVYQLDQRSCFRIEAAPQQVDRKWGWIYASISILIISATGLLGVAIVPLLKSAMFGYVLQFLVAIAVGTLCGDALLHLMPHAMHSNATTAGAREMDTIYKCSITFLTILLFYALEALMQMLHGGHSHEMPQQQSSDECKTGDRPDQPQPAKIELGAMLPDSPPPLEKLPQALTSTALMVILGDGLHNLTDGLAIGAAFSGDPVTGFATALAVFCHELPHELGDFAVLLRSGMSIRRALYYNLLSSFLSFMGMAIGLWLAEDHESASQWIYAATAGSFLYIGLADLVPEINSNSKGKVVNFFLAWTGILAGGVIMFFIAINEDALASLFKSFDT